MTVDVTDPRTVKKILKKGKDTALANSTTRLTGS
jgi:hypothetical protein